MRNPRLVLLVLAVMAVGTVATAAASDLWLHVRVEENEGARVKVNVPISMVEKAITMIPEEHLREGKIHLDGCCEELSIQEMRELWTELQNSPDMTFVTVEEEDESVRVWKENGYLKVHVSESADGDQVDVQVPLSVVDALLSSDSEELNIEAAIRQLVAEGQGELVTVHGQDEKVRVWVDNIAEAE